MVATSVETALPGMVEIYALSSYQVHISTIADKTGILEDTVATFGSAMAAGAAKTAWKAVNVVLAFGGRKTSKKP